MKNNNPKRQILRRGVLFLLAITIGFTATQPMNVMALVNISQKTQPKNPSVLPAQNVDTTKQQATFDTSSAPVSTSKKEDRTRDHEDVSKRTPFTSTYVNRDGTKTLSYSIDQQNFKRGKDWLKIDNKLEAVEKPVIQKNLFDVITNTAQKTDSPIAFRGKAGNASTQMKSLSEGVSIDVAGKTITMKPMGARNVTPVRKDDRTVAYKDAWPNVDLEYELRGESVKEIIVIKNKSAASTFNFKVSGGKVVNHPTRTGELTIEGMPAEFSFSSLTLDVNEQGVITEQRVTQKPSSDGIKVEMDKVWMQSQPAKSFPMRIDPTFGRYATSYWMFKS
ncbi:hypothetical protein H7X68_04030, partial [Candidatus Saccharibacteria bacterium]|nr:hypothetical protein [Candidatus Saccharibacteria bacterium]